MYFFLESWNFAKFSHTGANAPYTQWMNGMLCQQNGWQITKHNYFRNVRRQGDRMSLWKKLVLNVSRSFYSIINAQLKTEKSSPKCGVHTCILKTARSNSTILVILSTYALQCSWVPAFYSRMLLLTKKTETTQRKKPMYLYDLLLLSFLFGCRFEKLVYQSK
jgi:hypothetical protein